MAGRRLRAATRGSPLARWQAAHIGDLLRAADAELELELVVVETDGDRRADVPIWELGGKGAFAKEVQAAVLDGRADLAVHSAKDLPSAQLDGLVIACVPERGDPRDALVGSTLAGLREGAEVGTGSLRRQAQLAAVRPDLRFVGLRGNMATRIAKAADHDAVVVAGIALDRLGLGERIEERLATDVVLPQVGQGALAVECRTDDPDLRSLLAAVEHEPSRRCVDAERAFLVALGGDCSLPAAAYAVVTLEGALSIEGRVASADGATVLRHTVVGDDASIGAEVARVLLDDQGGRDAPRPLTRSIDPMTVYLVGAGPGDPGLLTVRGAALLQQADVVVYDRLSVETLLDLAPVDAERISVGKRPGAATMTQDEINALLVERGRTGARVVRLKGGDPFVFARGGEEAAALIEAGVAFEVVPGISSAVAAPAYAGIPLTLRHSSTSFTVVTGHEDPTVGDDGSVDWRSVAKVGRHDRGPDGCGPRAAHHRRAAGRWAVARHPRRRGALGHAPRAGDHPRDPGHAGGPATGGAIGARDRRGRGRAAVLVRGPAAVRAPGGRHPHPSAGLAARAGVAGGGRRAGRGAGDRGGRSQRRRSRAGPGCSRARGLRLDRRYVAQRGPPAPGRGRRRRRRRAPLRLGPRGRHRPGHRRGARGQWHRRGRRAAQVRG